MPADPPLAPPADRGRTTIADRVVERVAAAASAEVDAVLDTHGGWTRSLLGRGLPRAEAVVAGSTSRIAVEVACPWTAPLPAVTAEVRAHVARRVTELTGVVVARVDVSVTDVVHDATPARRVR